MIYGDEVAQKVVNSKILVIGAGGIGCELVKTLSVTGFTDITIIDLDTIDVSNLNRQFLFRREHVDMSKAKVLKEQIEKQNPHIKIEAHIGRIQEKRFNFKFFSKFDLVINALDNIEARNYVNQICFNLDIPLIEAGTNGYNANTISIAKNKTPCYECVEKPKDQSFPVCTIRQKPEKLIHCIVWAKALFDGLFGSKDQSDHIIDYLPEQIKDQSADKFDYAKQVFAKLFQEEVTNQIEAVKSKLQAPNLNPDEKQNEEAFLKKINMLDLTQFQDAILRDLDDKEYKLNKPELYDENNLIVLSLYEQIYTFIQSIIKIYNEKFDKIGSLTFDKDDDAIIDLVSSATNLRAYNFSVPMESKFKIKEMAGKIVPAISSSNALVASLQVFEAIKILAGQFDKLQGTVYKRFDAKKLQSFKRINETINPDCRTCSNDSKYIYYVDIKDFKHTTLKDLIENSLIKDIGLSDEFQIAFDSFSYEQCQDLDEDEEVMNKKKLVRSLTELSILDNSIIQVQGEFKDQSQGQSQVIYILLCECPEQDEAMKTVLLKKGVQSIKNKVPEKPQALLNGQSMELSDDDEVQETLENNPNPISIILTSELNGKRLHSEIQNEGVALDEDLEVVDSESNKRIKLS